MAQTSPSLPNFSSPGVCPVLFCTSGCPSSPPQPPPSPHPGLGWSPEGSQAEGWRAAAGAHREAMLAAGGRGTRRTHALHPPCRAPSSSLTSRGWVGRCPSWLEEEPGVLAVDGTLRRKITKRAPGALPALGPPTQAGGAEVGHPRRALPAQIRRGHALQSGRRHQCAGVPGGLVKRLAATHPQRLP